MQTEETFQQRVDRENSEKRTKVNAINKKLRKVADLLGFTFEDRNEKNGDSQWATSVHVRLTNGHESLWLSGEGYQTSDKIEVGVDFPRGLKDQRTDDYVVGYNQPVRPKIGITSTKTAEQIAKDIERRLLPAYRPLLAKALDLVAKWNAHENARLTTYKAVVGREPKTEYEKNNYSADLGDNVDVKVYDDNVTLTLGDLSVEDAKKVLAVLGK